MAFLAIHTRLSLGSPSPSMSMPAVTLVARAAEGSARRAVVEHTVAERPIAAERGGRVDLADHRARCVEREDQARG